MFIVPMFLWVQRTALEHLGLSFKHTLSLSLLLCGKSNAFSVCFFPIQFLFQQIPITAEYGQSRHGMKSFTDTSTHIQQWESNHRIFYIESNTLSTQPHACHQRGGVGKDWVLNFTWVKFQWQCKWCIWPSLLSDCASVEHDVNRHHVGVNRCVHVAERMGAPDLWLQGLGFDYQHCLYVDITGLTFYTASGHQDLIGPLCTAFMVRSIVQAALTPIPPGKWQNLENMSRLVMDIYRY